MCTFAGRVKQILGETTVCDAKGDHTHHATLPSWHEPPGGAYECHSFLRHERPQTQESGQRAGQKREADAPWGEPWTPVQPSIAGCGQPAHELWQICPPNFCCCEFQISLGADFPFQQWEFRDRAKCGTRSNSVPAYTKGEASASAFACGRTCVVTHVVEAGGDWVAPWARTLLWSQPLQTNDEGHSTEAWWPWWKSWGFCKETMLHQLAGGRRLEQCLDKP